MGKPARFHVMAIAALALAASFGWIGLAVTFAPEPGLSDQR